MSERVKELSVDDIARALALPVVGDRARTVRGVASLDKAGATDATFIAEEKYLSHLEASAAGVVILPSAHQRSCAATLLLSENPRLDYARLTQLLFPDAAVAPGIHPSAVVANDAAVDESAWIGAFAVVESGARIGAGCSIGAHCVVGQCCSVGQHTRLHARVVLYPGVTLGKSCVIHSGAVIGADGFGFAPDRDGRWHKVQQVGGVRIGDRVDIGANTTIDCGAIDDTVIEDGVILDNQIQIGHNVSLGENTAVAGCTGIAGSTKIGRRVQIGGHSAILGHLEVADDVV
ncbi:MAG: UDP-3-O-(3-hydroxymyristoyl)glucosamine N-acyltransferase, partial [Pseudomonadota bacterium]